MSNTTLSNSDDEPGNEAGYKNPPKASQFKSGRSGNPKGRPKKVSVKGKTVRDMADEKVLANGVMMTREEVAIMVAWHGAMKGKSDDRNFIFRKLEESMEGTVENFSPSLDDRIALEEYFQMLNQQLGKEVA